MWENVEAINFVKVNKLTDVEEKPGLYKIVNKNEPDKMIPGSKGHTFHACMKKYDFGTRKTKYILTLTS